MPSGHRTSVLLIPKYGRNKHSLIDFVAALYSKDGKDIGHAVDSMNANIRPEMFEHALKTGIPMHQELDLKSGAYLLRLGVMGRSSRKIGTVDVPLNNAARKEQGSS